ncbi:MAG TPA: UbiA family prenyltransferase, partial [Thermomicrobiales bacterium]|nr:UbiA family prenyltransferase [Thermomicrobiales bacterium]
STPGRSMSSEPAVADRPRAASRLRGYLALARISNSPTVVSDVLAGAALAGALWPNVTVVAVAVAMVFFYTAGMYLNDLCDYAIDCRQRPERPLPSGAVSRVEAAIAVVALFGIGAAVLWAAGSAAFRSGLVLIVVIVVYDLWHKTNPLSPALMAVTRSLVYVTAGLAVAGTVSLALLLWAGLLFVYVMGLTAIAKAEAGTSWAGYWPGALLAAPAVAFVAARPPVAAWPLLPLFVGWGAYAASFVYRAAGRNIGRAVGYLIAGIVLVDALALAVAGSGVGVVLALAAWALTLYLQRHIKGT